MTKPRRYLPLLAGAALLLLALPAHAQSNSSRLYLHLQLTGTSATYDLADFDGGDETHSGGGAGFQIGYGVSPLVTLYLGANGSSMENEDGDSYTLSHVDLGGRFNFRAGRRAVPYTNIAVAFRQADVDIRVGNQRGQIEYSGAGITVGGGLAFYLTETLALDGGLDLTFGTFTDVRAGNVQFDNQIDVPSTSARLGLGLSWYPVRF